MNIFGRSVHTNKTQHTETDLLNALLGNGSVNIFHHATMGAVFSVDECYSSLLTAVSSPMNWLDGDQVINPTKTFEK
jgi:hypothetical protein